MTDEQIRRAAKHYGIPVDEAYERYLKMQIHRDDPQDPICVGCAKKPHEIEGYILAEMNDPDDVPTEERVRRYVIVNEGTYNHENGHFLCDECYIKNGQPSSPSGWRCP